MQGNILLTANMITLLRHGSYLYPEKVKSLIKNKQTKKQFNLQDSIFFVKSTFIFHKKKF